jgi:predicted transposase YdaD
MEHNYAVERKEGRQEGLHDGHIDAAKNLLLMGFSTEDIAKATSLPPADIEGLKQ